MRSTLKEANFSGTVDVVMRAVFINLEWSFCLITNTSPVHRRPLLTSTPYTSHLPYPRSIPPPLSIRFNPLTFNSTSTLPVNPFTWQKTTVPSTFLRPDPLIPQSRSTLAPRWTNRPVEMSLPATMEAQTSNPRIRCRSTTKRHRLVHRSTIPSHHPTPLSRILPFRSRNTTTYGQRLYSWPTCLGWWWLVG